MTVWANIGHRQYTYILQLLNERNDFHIFFFYFEGVLFVYDFLFT